MIVHLTAHKPQSFFHGFQDWHVFRSDHALLCSICAHNMGTGHIFQFILKPVIYHCHREHVMASRQVSIPLNFRQGTPVRIAQRCFHPLNSLFQIYCIFGFISIQVLCQQICHHEGNCDIRHLTEFRIISSCRTGGRYCIGFGSHIQLNIDLFQHIC